MIDINNFKVMYRLEGSSYVVFVYDDNNCKKLKIPAFFCKEKDIVAYIKENYSCIFSFGEC